MSSQALAILGISSAIVNATAFVPYIASILKGKTKPERSSWWVWSALMAVAVLAQLAIGATWSVLFTAVFFVANIIVAILSVKYGYGKFGKHDIIAIVLTIVGLGLWWFTNNPVLALLITIAVDFMAYWLTIVKAWKAPYSENLLSWSLMTVAAILSVVSVGELDPAKIAFPLYVTAVSGFGVYILHKRRAWRAERIKKGIRKNKK